MKKALFAVSAIMYKFTPREEIPLETSVPEAPPSIIIPSDVPIYPPGGLYPNVDPIATPRSVPSVVGATNVQDLRGYADTGNTWPLYLSPLPVASGFTNASQSEELIVRVLCPLDKIGRVIGKGGGVIKSIRQASGAHIEVDNTKYDCDECVITITATEVQFCYTSFPVCFIIFWKSMVLVSFLFLSFSNYILSTLKVCCITLFIHFFLVMLFIC